MLDNLLGFAKHIGRKVFDTDAEAADNIRAHIIAADPGVDTLRVTFDDGTVTLTGRAIDQAAKEKTVLMAGNIKGVERVDATGISVIPGVTAEQLERSAAAAEAERPAAAAGTETRLYVIEKGDTLYGIAKKFYGNGMKYPQLFEANREVIQDPDKIYPGQSIRIPAAV
ncbi:MAG: peptidoglycan-binding protein LysM [Pseudomonadales bacterium]|jgi:nucleoid-associated protein YgaU|nr:peptidoglycan-binding protein LysM [Pseudomonadales bacterium]